MDNPDGPKTELSLALFREQQALLGTCVETLGSLARSVERMVDNEELRRHEVENLAKRQTDLEARFDALEQRVNGNGAATME